MPSDWRDRVPKHLCNRDRLICKAFGAGRAASEEWKLRSENPYQPSNADLYHAWDCGWLEGEEVYTVVKETAVA